MTVHERPGVYSDYDASSVVSTSGTGKTVGIAAMCSGGTAGQLYMLSRYEEGASTFGADEELAKLVELLFLNGAAAVYAVPVSGESDYAAAFTLLAETEGIDLMMCDSTTLSVQQSLRSSVADAAQARRERIAVVCGSAEETVSALIERANNLNSERVVLVAPAGEDGGARAAAAVAGAIAGENDPAVPLGGAVLKGLEGLKTRYSDSEIDLLVRGGVTPLESVAGQVSVVRGVTTRTKSGDVADATWRELTTILVVDDVIPTVRDALRTKFRRVKNTAQSRGAIRSQVVLELENKLAKEIITAYDAVTVTADPENPTVCLVDFSFTVAHGLNQIWLSAHITV